MELACSDVILTLTITMSEAGNPEEGRLKMPVAGKGALGHLSVGMEGSIVLL